MYKILLVEDDAALRYVYSKMKVWEEKGFQIVAEAQNGKVALEQLEKGSFDLMITDIRMPIIDGISLLRRMKEKGISMCTMLLSSYNEFEYARQGMILGAFDFIVKPVEARKLGDALGRISDYLDGMSEEKLQEQVVMDIALRQEIDLEKYQMVKNVCRYLSQELHHKLTMEEVAMEMKLSKDYFGKSFKQQTGMAFNVFYNLVKIEYAKQLLDSGKYKNYEISERLGYSDPDYFTKVFKEVTGMTPSIYKNH